MEISKELIAQAMKCGTTEELIELAQTNDIELSIEEAELFLRDYVEGELADEELENVSGGAKGCKRNAYPVVWFPTAESVKFIFNVGDVVQAFVGSLIGNETSTVRIKEQIILLDSDGLYQDAYKFDRIGGSPTCFSNSPQPRSRFEVSK